MDTIEFGNYPQGPNGETKVIEWLILESDDNSSLLLSKYALDCKPYNELFEETCWEKCSARQWLNNEFLNKAFNDEEKSQILISNVTADKNPNFDTDQGSDTEDKVFLLSVLESQKYIKDDKDRICWPTPYANKIGVWKWDESGACDNWLRTIGGSAYGATDVIIFGTIRFSGASVRGVSSGIRPAIRIKTCA